MRRYRQDLDEILSNLSMLAAGWEDEHSARVIRLLESMPVKNEYTAVDVRNHLLDVDFGAGITICRLFLDMSKDEFESEFRRTRGGRPIGIKAYTAEPEEFVSALQELGLLESMKAMVTTPMTWRDLLVERLKGGRGSAVRGQKRGRGLEDFTEKIVEDAFGVGGYEKRCRFGGERGYTEIPADFVIPRRDDPEIVIEAKAYGATGSKQTDVLWTARHISEEKRQDTHFLMVTDGITWRARQRDLQQILDLQNMGRISRIYTKAMADDLRRDLQTLKQELGL